VFTARSKVSKKCIFDMTDFKRNRAAVRKMQDGRYLKLKNPDTSTAKRTAQSRGYLLSNLRTWRLLSQQRKNTAMHITSTLIRSLCIIKFNSHDSGRHSKYEFSSSCLSVCPHGTTRLPLDKFFMKFDIWVFFLKTTQKIQVSLKSDKNYEYFTWRPI
jgi:hypothetical protein